MKRKLMKKTLAAVSALCMTAALTIPSITGMAADIVAINDATNSNGTITSVQGKTFNLYKIFSLTKITVTDGDDEYKYIIDDDWKGFFQNTSVIPTYTASMSEAEFNAAVVEYVSGFSGAAETQELAQALAKYAANNSIDPDSTKTGGAEATSVVFTESDITTTGYYLITQDVVSSSATSEDKVVSAFMLENIEDLSETLNITLKADKPTVEKKIVETGSTLVDANTANVNGTVNYQISSYVPDTTYYDYYWFELTDTFSAGLTFTPDTTSTGSSAFLFGNVEVKVGTDAVNAANFELPDGETLYWTTYDATNRVLKVIFNDKFMKLLGTEDDAATAETEGYGLAGTPITISYSAVVNENAVIGATGNPNKVDLTYSNNPADSGSGIERDEDTDEPTEPDEPDEPFNPEEENPPSEETTPEDIVITYLTEIQLRKVDSAGNSLTGAEFLLEGNGTAYTVKTSTSGTETTVTVTNNSTGAVSITKSVDASGALTFSGLGAGTYTITETKAPTGFVKLTSPITVTIECVLPKTVTAITDTCEWSPSATFGGEDFGDVDATSKVITLTVINRAGSLFPTTGGAGTTMFIIVGVLLITGAVVLTIVKKKSAAK